MALNIKMFKLPQVLEILDLSPVCLASNKLTCIALVSIRPIRGETRDIMPHFL